MIQAPPEPWVLSWLLYLPSGPIDSAAVAEADRVWVFERAWRERTFEGPLAELGYTKASTDWLEGVVLIRFDRTR